MGEKEIKISFWDYLGFYTVIGMIFLTVVWFHYRPWKLYHDNNRLEANGIATTAKLIEKKYTGASKGGGIHRLILEYLPSKAGNKEKRIIYMDVPPTVYNLEGIDYNNRIPILYLADDPDFIKLKNVEPELRPLVECILFDLMILGLVLYSVFSRFRKKHNPPQVE